MVFKYFKKIFDGNLKVKNPWNVFNKKYNFITNRQVIKLCHGNNLIDDFCDIFEVHVLFYVRHPISQSLSVMKRNWDYESIYSFLESENFANQYLDSERTRTILKTLRNGSLLEKHVLNWILYNLIPLNSEYLNKKFTVITYEELVRNPKKIIDFLSNKYKLNNKNIMMGNINKASKTTNKNRHKVVESQDRKYEILNSWKNKVNVEQRNKIQNLLDVFDIDIYSSDDILPNEKYLL